MAPWNAALRFALEMAALVGIGVGIWSLSGGPVGAIATATAVVATVTVWGVFNVPGDPSRSGSAPIAVRGWVRLAIELIVFGCGIAGFAVAGNGVAALVVGGLVVFHYLASGDRIAWLLA